MELLYAINNTHFYYKDCNNKIRILTLQEHEQQIIHQYEIAQEPCSEEQLIKLICKHNHKVLQKLWRD